MIRRCLGQTFVHFVLKQNEPKVQVQKRKLCHLKQLCNCYKRFLLLLYYSLSLFPQLPLCKKHILSSRNKRLPFLCVPSYFNWQPTHLSLFLIPTAFGNRYCPLLAITTSLIGYTLVISGFWTPLLKIYLFFICSCFRFTFWCLVWGLRNFRRFFNLFTIYFLTFVRYCYLRKFELQIAVLLIKC